MLIREMNRQEILNLINRSHFGRLGCAYEGQPYVVPFYFAYDGNYFYTFSAVGQKIAWMRMNPKVCIEVDEVLGHDHWLSVVVLGHYEELSNKPELKEIRDHAYQILRKNAMWWEPASVRSIPHRELEPVIFRIHVLQLTGHSAEPQP